MNGIYLNVVSEPLSYEFPARVFTLIVYFQPAAKAKHEATWWFLDALTNLDKPPKVSVRFQLLSDHSELQGTVNGVVLNRFRWVITSGERPTATEALRALTSGSCSDSALQKGLIGCSDFVKSLGFLKQTC